MQLHFLLKFAAQSKQLPCESVAHQHKVFTKEIEPYGKKTPSLAGTQLLDRTWLSLKTFLPRHLVAKQKAC